MFFVNASTSPGPALWQAIMFMILIPWAVWIVAAIPSMRAVTISVILIALFGLGLFITILKAGDTEAPVKTSVLEQPYTPRVSVSEWIYREAYRDVVGDSDKSPPHLIHKPRQP